MIFVNSCVLLLAHSSPNTGGIYSAMTMIMTMWSGLYSRDFEAGLNRGFVYIGRKYGADLQDSHMKTITSLSKMCAIFVDSVVIRSKIIRRIDTQLKFRDWWMVKEYMWFIFIFLGLDFFVLDSGDVSVNA